MKKLKPKLVILFLILQAALSAQLSGQSPNGGACQNCASKGGGGLSVMNGTASIASSYTFSACGLGYVQVTRPLHMRVAFPNTGLGDPQPATFSVTGIPSCKSIIKAFLYVSIEGGNGGTFTTNLVNPELGASSHSMTLIGSDVSACWSTNGVFSYRADVTGAVIGNGNYIVSGIPTTTNPAGPDANGATLFIIYSDPSQVFTGNIVIADGCQTNASFPSSYSCTIGGFSVCGTPTLTNNFMLVGDLQGLGNSSVTLNAPFPTASYVKLAATDQIWDFITAPGGAALSAQTSATYGVTNNDNDCFSIVMAGMYYRNACLNCLGTPALTMNVNVATSCPNSATVAASGGTLPYTFSWDGASPAGPVNNGLSQGNHTVIAADQSSCSVGSASFVVSIPTPTIFINTPTPVCPGSTVALNAGSAASYTWSPGTFLNATNIASVISTPSSGIIYTLNFSTAGGCIGSRTVAALTHILPVPVLTSNSPVCENGTIQLYGSGGVSYYWTGPNTFVSNLQNPVISGAVAASAGSYQLIVTDANTCQASVSASVMILPNPVISASGSGACVGAPGSLSASGAISYLWTGPNNFNVGLQNITFPAVIPAMAGVYTVTGLAQNLCTTSAVATLAILPPATLTASNVAACLGSSTTLTVSGAASYSWIGPNNYSSTSLNALIPFTNILTAGVYTVTGTGPGICTNTTTVTLYSLPLPVISVTGATVCLYQAAQISAAGAQTYSWTAPSGATSNQPIYVIQSSNSSVPLTYTVEGTDANSCTGMSTVQVVTLPLPQVLLSTKQKQICAGASATLIATGAVNYSWTPAGQPPLNTIVVTPAISTSFTVQGTDANGCTNTATVSVFVAACTGINEIDANKDVISVYPNPNNGNFTVASKIPVQLTVINTLGQYINVLNLDEKNNYTISVTDLEEGVYYLVSTEKLISEKVIIKK